MSYDVKIKESGVLRLVITDWETGGVLLDKELLLRAGMKIQYEIYSPDKKVL